MPLVRTNFKTKPRKSRFRAKRDDTAYRARLRQLPCVICNVPPPNTVHHLKATGERGMGMRSPDRFGLPMCWWPHGENCHGRLEAVGSKNELAWFAERGIDALNLCETLWAARDSLVAMQNVFWAHKD